MSAPRSNLDGAKFERGFSLMGPIALTVLGLMCVAPVVARLIRRVIVALCALLIILGLYFVPRVMIRAFRVFARVLIVVRTVPYSRY
jgi:ethanolamine transporter EutH